MDAQVFVVHQILDHSSGDTANTQLKSSSVGNHLGDELSNPLFLRSEGRHRQLGKGRVIFDDEIDVVDMQENLLRGCGGILGLTPTQSPAGPCGILPDCSLPIPPKLKQPWRSIGETAVIAVSISPFSTKIRGPGGTCCVHKKLSPPYRACGPHR